MQIRPLADDSDLVAATRACIADPPAIVVATTGVGFRGWMEAADGWGLGDALRTVLDNADVLARGPKAMGAIRAAGLRETWSPVSESLREVLDHLRAGDIRGVRIAVQLHGDPEPDLIEGLRAAGAVVIPVPIYQWRPPDDIAPLAKLIDLVATRNVDAVAFTSKPAVQAMLDLAEQVGRRDAVLAAFRGDVVPACVGQRHRGAAGVDRRQDAAAGPPAPRRPGAGDRRGAAPPPPGRAAGRRAPPGDPRPRRAGRPAHGGPAPGARWRCCAPSPNNPVA